MISRKSREGGRMPRITPEQARTELARRGINISPQGAQGMPSSSPQITPEQARAELARRQAQPAEPSLPQQVLTGVEQLPRNIAAYAAGGGQGLTNEAINAINTIIRTKIPQVDVPLARGSTFSPAGLGRMTGQALGFIGGGEAVKGLAGATKAIPQVGAAAERLMPILEKTPGILRRVLGQTAGAATFGATQAPSDPLRGAAIGAGLGGIASLLPEITAPVFKGAKKLVGAFKPQKEADSLMDYLSQGKSLTENNKSLAADVKAKANENKAISKANYANVLDKVGDEPVVSGPLALANKTQQFKPSEYSGLDEDTISEINKNPALKKMNNKFMENPTFKNAHELQSQLGSNMRSFKKTPLDPAGKNILAKYGAVRDALQNDMKFFLEKGSAPSLKNEYEAAGNHYLRDVVPYKEGKIGKISRGEIKNPRNISNIFKNPEDSVKKVVQDLGPDANRKIIYSELGKIRNPNAHNVRNSLTYLDKKGLSEYMYPELRGKLNDLTKKMWSRHIANAVTRHITNAVGTGIASGVGAHMLGTRGYGTAGATAAGALAGLSGSTLLLPRIMQSAAEKGLTRDIPQGMLEEESITPRVVRKETGDKLGRAARRAYPVAKGALLPHIINRSIGGNQ